MANFTNFYLADDEVSYSPDGFTLSGVAQSSRGVVDVTISAIVDGGARQNLGSASINENGNFSFVDMIGSNTQKSFEATLSEGDGTQQTIYDDSFSLIGGLGSSEKSARLTKYSSDGITETSRTLFRPNGSSVVNVEASNQTVDLLPSSVVGNHHQAGTAFVFGPGNGLDVINGFRATGSGHDTLSLSSADFGNSLANVLRDTVFTAGGAVIFDPVTNDIVRLAGVTRAQLTSNPKDITFHP